jgi:ATP-dependent DNA helicase DinG
MIICFDLETTGLDRRNDKIIEVALIKFDEKNFKIIDTFTSLVNPLIPIPEVITGITNIKNEDVFWAPIFEEIKQEISDFIWELPVLWHNVNFDKDFLVNYGVNIKNNIALDTFFLANFLCFKEVSLNLEMLCNSFDIWFLWAHRALNDVKATIKLFEKLKQKFDKLSKEKKSLLNYIFNKSEDKNIIYLKEYLFKEEINNYNFWEFEKIILKKIKKQDENENIIIDNNVDNNNMSNIFDSIDKVEKRDNQLKMTNVIMDSFNKSKKIVIEAPTWLWKSFAYLIPSIIHSLKTWEKVYISTKTKTLQDQLYSKDLNYLKHNLKHNFNYTKLKWKRNYLSLKSFFDEFWLDDFSYSKVAFLSKIVLWLYDTKYWELDELNYFGQEFSFLKTINADNFWVLGDKNNYKKYEFLYKVRKRLDSSNIIIINHSLLFSDVNTKTPILSDFHNLVIDEWHNIEDSVTDSLKQKYSLVNLKDTFDLIEKILIKINSKKIKFLKIKENLISKLELLDDYWFYYVDWKVAWNQKYKNVLLKIDFFENEDYTNILNKIELDFIDIIDKLSTEKDYDFTKESAILQSNLDLLKIILDKNSDNKYIKILNYNDKSWLSFEYTLLNPWEYLQNNLREKLKSCILTSATLQINWNFNYFKKLLFLESFEFLSFESDFNYNKQATLFIPTDLWNVKNNLDTSVKFLWRFFSIVKWKVLTLLTSFSVIKTIYWWLSNDLKKEGINLYAQWIAGSKIKLISFFMNNPSNSILLWTDSFWEGVDIPWDDIKYLVIHKFPFSVPTDPIFQARSVFFNDPFLEYSVPKAIIKLKQWFWRLIRTKTDKWLVILLDNRIISTAWWEAFFDAFPNNINVKKAKSEAFLDLLSKI